MSLFKNKKSVPVIAIYTAIFGSDNPNVIDPDMSNITYEMLDGNFSLRAKDFLKVLPIMYSGKFFHASHVNCDCVTCLIGISVNELGSIEDFIIESEEDSIPFDGETVSEKAPIVNCKRTTFSDISNQCDDISYIADYMCGLRYIYTGEILLTLYIPIRF